MSEKVLNEIREAIQKVVGDECDVVFSDVEKNNGTKHTAITIMEPMGNMFPQIYIDDELKSLEAGNLELQDVVKEIIDVYEKNKDAENLMEYIRSLSKQKILDNVICQLVNKDRNRVRIANMLHSDMLDLTIIYRVIIERRGNGTVSFILNHDLCKIYGIDFEELDAAAKKNTKHEGIKVFSMASIMESHGIKEDSMEKTLNDMCVITNNRMIYGAVAMIFPEELQKVSQIFDDDLYVLPSSIHEVIAIPVTGHRLDMINETVCEINTAMVSDEDFLSNSVYRYDRSDGKINIEQKM